MSNKKAITFGTLVTGTLFLNSMPFCVLFDSGPTPFMLTRSAIQLDLEHFKVENNCIIKLPNDSIVECPFLYKHVFISIGEYIFLGDLNLFDLSDLDIILGMNRLHIYEAKIGCKDLKVILSDEKGREVCFYG